jgi:hypothetical protein
MDTMAATPDARYSTAASASSRPNEHPSREMPPTTKQATVEMAHTAPTVERRADWIIVVPRSALALSIPPSRLTVNHADAHAAVET